MPKSLKQAVAELEMVLILLQAKNFLLMEEISVVWAWGGMRIEIEANLVQTQLNFLLFFNLIIFYFNQ